MELARAMKNRAGSRALPFAGASALIVATMMIVGLVALANGLSNSEREEAEITKVVEAIAAESTAVTNSYFAGPESVAYVIEQSLQPESDADELISLLRNLTTSQPNVDGSFIGYPDGSFIDVRREFGSVAGLRIKTIEITDGERNVDVEIIDPASDSVRFPLSGDTYDPRVRPWYVGVEGRAEHWTDPYVFFSSNEPGITYSRSITDETGALVAVVGVDVRLTDLHTFLEERQPSENGGAAVLTSSGELIAGETNLLAAPSGTDAIDEMFISTVDSAGTTVRLGSSDPRIVVGTRVTAAGTQLLVVDAPENDFLRDIRAERRNYALLASALGGAGVLLLLLGAVLIGRHLQRLGRLAETDSLTGLLNRSAVHEQTLVALGAGQDVAVMAIDLDDFKLVNDQFGHEGGDRALTCVAQRLQAKSPENTIIGRLGGDEFSLVLIDCNKPDEVFRAIIEQAAGKVEASNYTFDLQLSAGYTIADSDETPRELFRQADIALYEAKASRGTTIVQFDDAMHLRWHRDGERSDRLEEAIQNNEMELHFQPEFDLETGEVVGAEGLLRWNHPTQGLVSAVDFIEDIERFDLLPKLVPMLFSEATALTAAMPSDGPFTLRLNVAAEQLGDLALINHLEQVTRADDHTVWCLEVTERTMVAANNQVKATLDQLRASGVEVALDDFGTGYSSLNELQRLPVDAIKIDRSFVADLDASDPTQSIAAVLVNLAKILDIDVIAEGIETHEQRKALLSLGCVSGQGFLLGEPVSARDFIERWGIEHIADRQHPQAKAS